MSDRKQELEDLAIEQAWERVMATGHEPRLLPGGEAADAGAVREYTELLGLLPYELSPEVPSTHIKEAIMARVAGVPAASSQESAAVEADGASSGSSEHGHPGVVPFERPAYKPETPAPRPFWRYAQAAVLAASLVGLGFMSATIRQQNQQIAQLNGQLQASVLDSTEMLQVRDEVRTLRSRLNMVTSVARKAYPMQTVSGPGAGAARGNATAQEPEGIVYVCGAHQQWYLSLRGLEPPEGGGEYHLWFMTEEGKVDGGVLEVSADSPAEMDAQSMPDGTRGFLVTLEKPDEPEGLTILLGESQINL